AALVTGCDMIDRYYEPLARSQLLAPTLVEHTQVVAIGRRGLLKGEALTTSERAAVPFLLRLRTADGNERSAEADVVIDATGTFGNPNWLGEGGIPASGESALRDQIESGLPDVLGGQREKYARNHTLVVGAGFSAATTTVALARLACEFRGTRVTWITRADEPAGPASPIARIQADRLPLRDQLAAAANELACGSSGAITHLPGTTVGAIQQSGRQGAISVQFAGRHEREEAFDRIVANVGYRPDRSLYEELHVHECYATGGPMRLAASLVKTASADCLDQKSTGPESLITTEPNFFILGSKSYGRLSRRFLLANGLAQVNDLFTMLKSS
ncbi:MAG: FAD-dependent oxidoreductase, partial [Pirellulales bacterium]